MGLSIRIFVVREDDSIERLSLARYERLLDLNPKERLPKFAGKRVRYALVVVDLVNRRPVEILKTEYSYLLLDSQGRLDLAEQKKEVKLAVDAMPLLLSFRDEAPVVDARHRFAKKRYDDKYRWTPSPEVVAAIENSIFRKDD